MSVGCLSEAVASVTSSLLLGNILVSLVSFRNMSALFSFLLYSHVFVCVSVYVSMSMCLGLSVSVCDNAHVNGCASMCVVLVSFRQNWLKASDFAETLFKESRWSKVSFVVVHCACFTHTRTHAHTHKHTRARARTHCSLFPPEVSIHYQVGGVENFFIH